MGPVTDILNSCSVSEGYLPPTVLEIGRYIVPIPKRKPVNDVNKDLRPISLTPVLSKIAEEFVVEEYVRTAMLKKIDDSQFGSIPSVLHHACVTQHGSLVIDSWTKQTDGTSSTVRVVLLDHRKAFDLIDHTILAHKLMTLDIPQGIMCWVIDFLKNRRQRVKMEQDCKSEWGDSSAGIPQGTRIVLEL